MSKQQKQIALIAGAAILLYAIYRWQISRTSSSSTPGTDPNAAANYATLAGQEQSDVAALQGQNSQLQGLIQGNQAQEQSDISGLTGSLAGLTSTVDNLQAPNLSGITNQINSIAAGVTKLNRATLATVQTHKGGPFYHYYVKVTGHAPPAHLQVNNAIWQAYKSGIKATALQGTKPHPSAPKQTHVAHPNANHTQQSGTTRSPLPSASPKGTHPGGGAIRTKLPKPKPTPAPKPSPKRPVAKPVKPSGRRK